MTASDEVIEQYRREQQTIKEYESNGYACVHSPGEISPVNIVAIKDGEVKLLRVTSKRHVMKRKAKLKMQKFSEIAGISVEVKII